MADMVRKEMDSRVGPGGIKCDCCGGSHKDCKKTTRAVRRKNKQKLKSEVFESFLDNLKGSGHDNLIESIKAGFQTCFENENEQKVKKGICPLCNNKTLKEIDRSDNMVAVECPECNREFEYQV